MRRSRVCACGCGEPLLGKADQRYVDVAHKQRVYRARKTARDEQRRAARAAELRTRPAAAAREPAALKELLRRALQAASRHPDPLIVLRAGGELHPLAAAEIVTLVEGLAALEREAT